MRLLQIVFVLLLTFADGAVAKTTFTFNDVVSRAEQLARVRFEDLRGQVPQWLLEISYDQWRDIRFRPEHSLWRDRKLPFELQFFHPGLFYDRVVTMNIVDSAGVHPLMFSPSQFDYGQNKFGSQVPQNLGYAGFRVHYPIKSRTYKDEVIVFLGASYFRALGRDNVFGVSARGVAVDTALPSGEEFPYFREFWIMRPTPNDNHLTIFALLDSARVTGAYHFVVKPGEQTVVEVEVRLFLRESVGKLGVAPLTSMFLFGENTLTRPEDYRPEVHDSDGLLMHSASGEWLWRPLNNPQRLRVSAFQFTNPKGFGLLQRDRDFASYQDLETRAELRPSVWIEPRGDWGEGAVELVEIPTKADIHDNIVAFWVPRQPPLPHEPYALTYTMYWYSEDASRPPGGRTFATRRDRGTYEDGHRFVIDFRSKQLAKLDANTVLRGVITVGRGNGEDGELLEQVVQKNPITNDWRLMFQVRPKKRDPLDLRAFLQKGTDALTETWVFQIEP